LLEKLESTRYWYQPVVIPCFIFLLCNEAFGLRYFAYSVNKNHFSLSAEFRLPIQSELNFLAQKNGEKETRNKSYIYKFSPELIIEFGKKKRMFIHRTSEQKPHRLVVPIAV